MSDKDSPFKRTVLIGETPDGKRLLNDAPPKCVKNPLKTSCEIDPDWAADKIKQQQETIERLREIKRYAKDLLEFREDEDYELVKPGILSFLSEAIESYEALLQEQEGGKTYKNCIFKDMDAAIICQGSDKDE